MSAIKLSIQEDMKSAMRAKDSARLGTIRLILAALKQKEVDERITLDDAAVLQILNKMIKQRRESISQYEAGGREDLAQKEKEEIKVLQTYLPQQMSETEVEAIVKDAVATTGAASVKDMGKVMAMVKEKTAGRADMAIVSATVKRLLNA